MAAKIKYPKIRGKVGALLAIGIITSLLSIEIQKWMYLGNSDNIYEYYRIVAYFGLGLVIIYVFIGPLFMIFSNKD